MEFRKYDKVVMTTEGSKKIGNILSIRKIDTFLTIVYIRFTGDNSFYNGWYSSKHIKKIAIKNQQLLFDFWYENDR